jgi:hypothetical protein
MEEEERKIEEKTFCTEIGKKQKHSSKRKGKKEVKTKKDG